MAKSLVNQRKRGSPREPLGRSRGMHVPAFMIASVTHRCNLRCKGCYAMAQHLLPETEMEMSADKLRKTIGEAKELGRIHRPPRRGRTADAVRRFWKSRETIPDIIFPLFTNGTLITDETVKQFKKQRNVIPVVSLEGHRSETDARRGAGTYYRVTKVMEHDEKGGHFLRDVDYGDAAEFRWR